MYQKGIAHLVFYTNFVYNLRKVEDAANFIPSASNIVKLFRRRQDDPAIMDMTIGLVLGP